MSDPNTEPIDPNLYCAGLNLAGNPQGTKNAKTDVQVSGPINLWCRDINKDNWTNPAILLDKGCTQDNEVGFGRYKKRQAYCTGRAGVATSTVLCPDGQVFSYNYQTQKGQCETGTYTEKTISYKDDTRYCTTGTQPEGLGYKINNPVPLVGPNLEPVTDPNDPALQGIDNWNPQDPNTWNYYTNRFYCDTENQLADCGVNMVFKGGKCTIGDEGDLEQNYPPLTPKPPPGQDICTGSNPCLELDNLKNPVSGGIYPVPGTETDNLSTSCFCQVPFGEGSGVLQQCPRGTVFDNGLKICNFPP